MSRKKLQRHMTGRDYVKIIALLFASVLVLTVIIRFTWSDGSFNFLPGNPTETQSPASQTSLETTSVVSGQFVIGISQPNFAEPWRLVANAQLKAAAAEHPEFKLIFMDGRLDNNKQISDIQSLIDQEVDLIIVSPNEAKPLTAIISKAYNAGIPVILVDRAIEGEDYTQFIGADNEQIGYMAGQWVAGYLGETGGLVVELTGEPGTSAQIARHDGFISVIENYPNIEIIDSQSMDWIYDRSIKVMETMLEKHSKIDVIFAHNDSGAEGAYTAALAAGREAEIKFVGIDALPTLSGGIMSVIDGRIDVTYTYPTGSAEAIESAYQLLVLGQEIPRTLTLQTLEITPENAQEVYNQLSGTNTQIS